MVILQDFPDPQWLELPGLRLRLQVRMMTTALAVVARARVTRFAAEAAAGQLTLKRAGNDVAGCSDLADDAVRHGMAEWLSVRALAHAVIVGWEGVYLSDGATPAPVTAETVDQLIAIAPIAAAFSQAYRSALPGGIVAHG